MQLLSANPPVAFPIVQGALRRLSRLELEELAQTLIEHLDELEGDPDLELSGDEFDSTGAEDDFGSWQGSYFSGPGCPISDPH